MCNPNPDLVWPVCQDDPTIRHNHLNPDVTVGPDHDNPHQFSVTDGAGTFNIVRPTEVAAIIAFTYGARQ